jgi:hypothetical protein
LLVCGRPALAETVEVAPGVQVTKRTYSAPINEQPFFGFAVKNTAQRAADESFVKALTEAAGTREKAFDETTKRGWRAMSSGNVAEAAQRFNQAFLLAPEQSGVYHGFAAVAQTRFNDSDFADELFKIARKLPNPLKTLNADYGRALLIARRPREAQPVLEHLSRTLRILAMPGPILLGPGCKTMTALLPVPLRTKLPGNVLPAMPTPI